MTTSSKAVPRPRWEAERRKLWYRGRVVKWFRQPTKSQEPILAAFEEEGWPRRIDDPLPPVAGRDSGVRLHEAVKGLNRGHINRLIEFRRDGTGEGVEWLPIT